MKQVMSMDYTDVLQTNDISGLEAYLRDHDVNEQVHGQSPLYWAVFQNNAAFCQILIDHGAHVNHQDSFGRTALSTACYFEFTTIAKLLLKHQATIDTQCMRRAYHGWDGHIQVQV
jgi:ankyrin repeat protein